MAIFSAAAPCTWVPRPGCSTSSFGLRPPLWRVPPLSWPTPREECSRSADPPPWTLWLQWRLLCHAPRCSRSASCGAWRTSASKSCTIRIIRGFEVIFNKTEMSKRYNQENGTWSVPDLTPGAGVLGRFRIALLAGCCDGVDFSEILLEILLELCCQVDIGNIGQLIYVHLMRKMWRAHVLEKVNNFFVVYLNSSHSTSSAG